MKKRILVLCGAGIGSSTAMFEIIDDFCRREHIQVSIDKAALLDFRGDQECEVINSYDVVVSITKVPAAVKVKVINGIDLITGFGADEAPDEIKTCLQA